MSNNKESRIGELRILIVDDCPIMRMQYDEFLKEMGIKSRAYAENGEIAKTILDNQKEYYRKNGFIICDINMPEVNGFEFLKNVRSIREFKDIPFLMVSAERERSKIIQSIEDGANLFLMKPFSASTLRKKVLAIMD